MKPIIFLLGTLFSHYFLVAMDSETHTINFCKKDVYPLAIPLTKRYSPESYRVTINNKEIEVSKEHPYTLLVMPSEDHHPQFGLLVYTVTQHHMQYYFMPLHFTYREPTDTEISLSTAKFPELPKNILPSPLLFPDRWRLTIFGLALFGGYQALRKIYKCWRDT